MSREREREQIMAKLCELVKSRYGNYARYAHNRVFYSGLASARCSLRSYVRWWAYLLISKTE